MKYDPKYDRQNRCHALFDGHFSASDFCQVHQNKLTARFVQWGICIHRMKAKCFQLSSTLIPCPHLIADLPYYM